MRTLLSLLLPLLAFSCAGRETTARRLDVVHEGGDREALFDQMAGLAGRWVQDLPDGTQLDYEFAVTSGGHAVRETMMLGADEEMTNMYTRDGKDLVLTHYCAGGNQVSMRVGEFEPNRMAFEFDSVRDLNAPDEIYMGQMTLVIVDEDHIEEHWSALQYESVEHENVIRLRRAQ